MVEQRAQHPLDPGLVLLGIWGEIHAREHEVAQAQHRAPHRLALHDVAGALGALEQVDHQGLDPLRPGGPEQVDLGDREVLEGQHAGPDGVVDVVVDVGDPVDEPHDPALQRGGRLGPGVAQDAVTDRPGEVQPLEPVDHAQRVLVVAKGPPPAPAHRLVQHLLAHVAEGRVPEVVPERDRLGQVLVERQSPGHVAGDPRGLERMREPRAVVITLRRDEHLGLVLQPPEGLGVDDPVAVALERRAVIGVGLGLQALRRVGTRRERGQRLLLEPLHPLPERDAGELGHGQPDSRSRAYCFSVMAAWAAATRAIGTR